uniref:Neuroguidin n=2 Tax=Guillardia theta TaxID=55529 RepID=A0A7S4P3F0_GUITH|mmetsp:Transcript_42494/g.133848  ORF Transcript_42494/g.133848 Transcript_42494/m.133848 type:complete len:385 (+) Transcript_42494:54-1208(+)
MVETSREKVRNKAANQNTPSSTPKAKGAVNSAQKKKSAKKIVDHDKEHVKETDQAVDAFADVSQQLREEVLTAEAPDLIAMLRDFKSQIAEVRTQLSADTERVKEGALPTSNGVSYLELKLQLLLSYCTNLSFYLFLKLNGMSIMNHPVIKKLIELRIFMEKMRPMDTKLKYQMDKLLKINTNTESSTAEQENALRFKPNPEALLAPGETAGAREEGDEEDGEEGDRDAADKQGVYRPPKISAMHFEDKEEAKKRRAHERKAKKAAKSEIVMALREQFDDAPVEMESIGASSQYKDEELAHRTKFEEDNFLRLQVSKKERHRLKQMKRKGASIDGFEEYDNLTFDNVANHQDLSEQESKILKKRSFEDVGRLPGNKKSKKRGAR